MKKEKKIDELKRLCVLNNKSLYTVCREARVPISTIANWTRKEPNAFEVYEKLMKVINE